ncbi:MAG: 4a-hydroxytetrahydrobiopterin dehydratase [Acidimicrobiia bacterium]|nr:MAG: 4a-hydroxytetrahydrobiopterin dehydratase [Acidimicrobiia bacterium]
MARLSAEDREQFTAGNPDWHLDGETITRTYQFGTFAAAIGFVTKVAMAAEVADHHPDIDIRWTKVTLALTTHFEKALTAKDTDLAAKADVLAG